MKTHDRGTHCRDKKFHHLAQPMIAITSPATLVTEVRSDCQKLLRFSALLAVRFASPRVNSPQGEA